jgi:hypothetical protein
MEKDRAICLTSKKIEIRHFYFACKALNTLCFRRAHREREHAIMRRFDQSGINQDARLVEPDPCTLLGSTKVRILRSVREARP